MTLPILFLLVPAIGVRRLIGCDIAFAAFLIPVAAAGHAALGNINYAIALNLLVGSLPGVYVGSKLCKFLSEIWLRPAVAAVLIICGQSAYLRLLRTSERNVFPAAESISRPIALSRSVIGYAVVQNFRA